MATTSNTINTVTISNTINTEEHKRSVLEHLVEKHKDSTEQRSTAWFAMMDTTYGGSEQAVIAGGAKYGTVADLVARKTGLVKAMDGNIFTRWGTFMEKAIAPLMGRILKMTIREFGAIMGPVPFQRCSPDGIGVAKIKYKGKRRWRLLLLEYKCPFTRIPDGTIPPDYVHQLKTGLCTIKELDMCLFVDSMTRICSRNDYGFNQMYNKYVHDNDVKNKVSVDDPLCMGTYIFYQTDRQRKHFRFINGRDDGCRGECDDDSKIDMNDYEKSKACIQTLAAERKVDYSTADRLIMAYDSDHDKVSQLVYDKEMDEYTMDDLDEHMIDFGTSSKYIISRLLQLVEKKVITAVSLKTCLFPRELARVKFLRKQKCRYIEEYTDEEWDAKVAELEAAEVHKFKDMCDDIMRADRGNRLIGHIAWKMFKWEMILYKNDDPDYLNRQAVKMAEISRIVAEIRASPRPWEVYHKYYPTKNKKYNDDNVDATDVNVADEDRLAANQAAAASFVMHPDDA